MPSARQSSEPTPYRLKADEQNEPKSADELCAEIVAVGEEIAKSHDEHVNPKRLWRCLLLAALQRKVGLPGQPKTFKQLLTEKPFPHVTYDRATTYAKIGRSADPEAEFVKLLKKEARTSQGHRDREKDETTSLRKAVDKLKNAKWTDEEQLDTLLELRDSWGKTAADLLAREFGTSVTDAQVRAWINGRNVFSLRGKRLNLNRIANFLAMLSSDVDGEKLNAVDALKRELTSSGLSLVDLAEILRRSAAAGQMAAD